MKNVLAFILILSIIFTLACCGEKAKSAKAKFILADVKSPVELNTKNQKGYLNDSDYNNHRLYCNDSRDDTPLPVKISWKYEGESKPDQFVVRVSESKNFEDFIAERTRRNNATIYNLKLGTKYYYYVAAVFDFEETPSEIKEFTTVSDGVRFINCDGIKNMRDIGNFKTESGKTVKQGLIYRCGKLNNNKETSPIITANGLYVMKHLGIKTEIDLRTTSEAARTSSLIEGAKYEIISILGSNNYNPANIYERNDIQLVSLFKVLGNKDNYPLIIHCAGGADRTGFVCYTLSGLLGVKKDDLVRDYLLTNFAINYSTSARVYSAIENDYVAGYEKCSGNTLSEKIENRLLELGVAKSDIDNFKSIMLE